MRLRIGVHLGEIIEKPAGTVYGDGVNVAAPSRDWPSREALGLEETRAALAEFLRFVRGSTVAFPPGVTVPEAFASVCVDR